MENGVFYSIYIICIDGVRVVDVCLFGLVWYFWVCSVIVYVECTDVFGDILRSDIVELYSRFIFFLY